MTIKNHQQIVQLGQIWPEKKPQGDVIFFIPKYPKICETILCNSTYQKMTSFNICFVFLSFVLVVLCQKSCTFTPPPLFYLPQNLDCAIYNYNGIFDGSNVSPIDYNLYCIVSICNFEGLLFFDLFNYRVAIISPSKIQ